jgi:hypothetical protein
MMKPVEAIGTPENRPQLRNSPNGWSLEAWVTAARPKM